MSDKLLNAFSVTKLSAKLSVIIHYYLCNPAVSRITSSNRKLAFTVKLYLNVFVFTISILHLFPRGIRYSCKVTLKMAILLSAGCGFIRVGIEAIQNVEENKVIIASVS